MLKTLGTLLAACAIALSAVLPAPARQTTTPEVEGWDTSALDARIEELAQEAAAPGASTSAKQDAAAAYLERGNIFYSAGQPRLYKFALGDFRRALRFWPGNAEAREKADMIVSIYESMARPVPEEGKGDELFLNFKPKAKPVEFKPGQTSAMVTEKLPPRLAYLYEVNIPAGKLLQLSISSDGAAAVFTVSRVRGEESSELASGVTSWSGALPEAGKYHVKVSSAKTKTAETYRLKATIR